MRDDNEQQTNPESGTAAPGSKWGAPRRPPESEGGGPSAAEPPSAHDMGNFGEGTFEPVPSDEGTGDVRGANRGD